MPDPTPAAVSTRSDTLAADPPESVDSPEIAALLARGRSTPADVSALRKAVRTATDATAAEQRARRLTAALIAAGEPVTENEERR